MLFTVQLEKSLKSYPDFLVEFPFWKMPNFVFKCPAVPFVKPPVQAHYQDKVPFK